MKSEPSTPPSSAPDTVEAARRQFVEDYGVFIESRGQLPRMAGRIMGQLLLSNDELQTQAQLCEALQASAGAVSSTLRLLQERGYVERVSRPGIRKDFYRIADEIWTRDLENARRHYDTFSELTTRGLEISTHFNDAAQARLREMHDLAEIEASHYEQVLDQWYAHRHRND